MTRTEVNYLGGEHFNGGNGITEAWRLNVLGMLGNTQHMGEHKKVRLVGAE